MQEHHSVDPKCTTIPSIQCNSVVHRYCFKVQHRAGEVTEPVSVTSEGTLSVHEVHPDMNL